MEFVDAIPVAFKEITPNHNISEKWKEIVLNTGGTHSTLQDIKLPQKAGGYWYRESQKANTRNRLIYWQTTSDAIELSEASLDVNLSGANLRCKVAPGTPPLNNMTVYERTANQEMIILAATVSSVHRLVFPHPEVLDKKATFGSMSTTSPSIFQETSAINNPNNYYILNQYATPTTGVAHTCASMLRDNGEAVFALAFGHGGEGGLLLVKLPVAGAAVTTLLKRESTVPRFLSGITGALRGKTDGVETYGVVLTNTMTVAVCGDTCLRGWALDEGGAPTAVSPPLSQTLVRPKPPPHGHMLQKTAGTDGSVILVAYLSFPNECEFVVMKMHGSGAGVVKFAHICRIFGPQLDLLDYKIGYGDGNNVVWALWSQPDGETIITSSALGPEVSWRAVCGREPPPPLLHYSTHQQYRDRLMAPGLFPPAVLNKALVIYRRTWGTETGANVTTGVDGDLGEACISAVQSRICHLAARAQASDHSHLMHKCWSDLYSWCMQYMEGLQKPLGLMVSKHGSDMDSGWWCAVVRRAGISLIRELEPLERLMLSPESTSLGILGSETGELSSDAVRVVVAGAQWERSTTLAGAAELERRLFAAAAPQHRLLPRLLHLLMAPQPTNQSHAQSTLTPQQIDELTSILEPIKDLQNAVLELNDALRLDVPDIDISKSDEEETNEYDNLFASDLGVSVVTEAIRQMAEMRSRVVRGALAALGAARGAGDVPGAGHCAVHWQAYRALLWLRAATLHRPAAGTAEAFRLKLSALGAEASALSGAESTLRAGGLVHEYARAAGGRRARAHLAAARAPTHWHQAMPLMAYHLAHQLWAVSGGFEFGWWLASVNQPRLVQNYVSMLEPWCEWNACSRQFILGLSLLDLEDAENAYTAFCKAAKGVSTEPFLRQLVAAPDARLTQHQALVLYYMKVIKLFEIHDAGACVVRLAETAISIADKDDPNLAMFQWLVFKWHLAGGRIERALSAAAASPAPHARQAAAATLLTTLAQRKQLGALVSCGALANDAERAAAARAKLHDAHTHNPYYDFLYALHISRHHYRKAAAVMYERAARCAAERTTGADRMRRRWLAAALTCLRLAKPDHAFLARPAQNSLQVIGPEELAAELREEDPDSMDPVQQALLKNENIDFESLYPRLKEADPETLLAVTKRVLSTDQFLPRWFVLRYMEVDGAGCIRALLSGGRVVEAGSACCEALRSALCSIQPYSPAAPRAAPLALADLLIAELHHHLQHPASKQVYDELTQLIKDYTQVVIRTSDDMKVAQLKHAINVKNN
ncbi:nuclear pore complex protein Nup160 homolog isoform X2 [Hyposmocoma kahamanoa]|uniref:nuclear pore complex protein Nup160 homolog isoform X2 n=1 Tax=Hyposmocoma kahamanoa TaxID=1477025 RepID=UPI000E6D79D6|nr:nuclear pore complex protein Nup160 homolog isoform X2 [Hyposmocoma kahamanoa]